MKIGSTQSHLGWPPCRMVWSVSQLLYAMAGHFKFLLHHFFVRLGLAVATSLKQIAKRSKTVLIMYMIYQNWCAKKRFRAGNIVGPSGAVETEVSDSLRYINRTFDDYIKYSGISIHNLQDITVLEVGPGDNLGVA